MISNYPQLSLPKVFGEIVTEMNADILTELQAQDSNILQISYLHGNIKEIAAKLVAKRNAPKLKAKMFPLVLLIEDITIDRRLGSNMYGTANVNVIICNHTKAGLTSEQREDANFVKILRPMYHSLLYQIGQHRAFTLYSDRNIPHTMTERKLWGNDAKTEHALGDYIDAIDLMNMELPLNWNYCNYVTSQDITT